VGGKELIGGAFLGLRVRKCCVFIGGFVLLFLSRWDWLIWWGESPRSKEKWV
jgi:hypothetical protein